MSAVSRRKDEKLIKTDLSVFDLFYTFGFTL